LRKAGCRLGDIFKGSSAKNNNICLNPRTLDP
jgi:hypothetical protein